MSSKLRIFAGLLTVLVLAVALTLPHLKGWLADAVQWTAGLGAWGPLLFVALFTVAAMLLVPASVLCLGAGAVFGLLQGAILAVVGATLGATAAFLAGRYLARDWAKAKVAHHLHFAAIDAAVAREGWKIVLLARLCPVFPYILLNYALGLTSVGLRSYVIGTIAGVTPSMIVLVYVGSLANATTTGGRTPAEWALLGLGLAATVIISVYLTRVARRALDGKMPAPPTS